MSKLTKVPIELILRSVQKDNEYLSFLRVKVLELIDSCSYFKVFSIDSEVIDFFNNFIYYLINYKLSDDKNTPGEDYVRIKKNLEKKKNISITLYICLISSFSLLTRKIYERINIVLSHLKNFFKEKSIEKKSYTLHILHQVIQRVLDKFPTEEQFFNKIEEIQFCLFFINQRYYDLFQSFFDLKYDSIGNKIMKDELIGAGAFTFLGKLSFLKLLFELILLFIKFKGMCKEEEQVLINSKTNIFEVSNNIQRLNFKLKGSHIKKLQTNPSEGKNCLLCLDERKNTSSTPCGHLFCWECIIKYLQRNQSCPFCRKICLPQSVIFLQNFN